MLTREQWEALARFAGGKFTNDSVLGPTFDYRSESGGGYISPWQPLTDWNDFGPLWVLLERWMCVTPWITACPSVYIYVGRFNTAMMTGTKQDLMQAGCLLGAAIGATMKPALAADKETP